ncbi:hypothetical protein ACQ5SK_25250 [Bradyrhizobium japonicum]
MLVNQRQAQLRYLSRRRVRGIDQCRALRAGLPHDRLLSIEHLFGKVARQAKFGMRREGGKEVRPLAREARIGLGKQLSCPLSRIAPRLAPE